jgi:hypothetical protein
LGWRKRVTPFSEKGVSTRRGLQADAGAKRGFRV